MATGNLFKTIGMISGKTVGKKIITRNHKNGWHGHSPFPFNGICSEENPEMKSFIFDLFFIHINAVPKQCYYKLWRIWYDCSTKTLFIPWYDCSNLCDFPERVLKWSFLLRSLCPARRLRQLRLPSSNSASKWNLMKQ